MQQGPVWLPAIGKLFYVSNRLGDTESSNQYVELWLLDLQTLETTQVQPKVPILVANGATNWSPSEVLILQQVGSPALVFCTSAAALLTTGECRIHT